MQRVEELKSYTNFNLFCYSYNRNNGNSRNNRNSTIFEYNHLIISEYIDWKIDDSILYYNSNIYSPKINICLEDDEVKNILLDFDSGYENSDSDLVKLMRIFQI